MCHDGAPEIPPSVAPDSPASRAAAIKSRMAWGGGGVGVLDRPAASSRRIRCAAGPRGHAAGLRVEAAGCRRVVGAGNGGGGCAGDHGTASIVRAGIAMRRNRLGRSRRSLTRGAAEFRRPIGARRGVIEAGGSRGARSAAAASAIGGPGLGATSAAAAFFLVVVYRSASGAIHVHCCAPKSPSAGNGRRRSWAGRGPAPPPAPTRAPERLDLTTSRRARRLANPASSAVPVALAAG